MGKKNPWPVYVPVSLPLVETKNLGKMLVLKGPPGEKGQPGVRGRRGKAGPRGIKGDIGEMGRKGDAGSIGPRGSQGKKGEKGNQGPRELKGASIEAPRITVRPMDQTVTSTGFASFTC